ncbi:MAG: hypothetical protein Q7S92_00940 [Candidatus Diapherotrites archaeon]|nr:hypothetical protein [Candidatus Diapherotrites archaeon]
MNYEVHTQRVTAVQIDLTLVKDGTETLATLSIQYKKEKSELFIKGFKPGFSGEFTRSTGKTPGEALFEYAVSMYGNNANGVVIKGNIEHIIGARTAEHFEKIGILEFVEENVWLVTPEAAKKLNPNF